MIGCTTALGSPFSHAHAHVHAHAHAHKHTMIGCTIAVGSHHASVYEQDQTDSRAVAQMEVA